MKMVPLGNFRSVANGGVALPELGRFDGTDDFWKRAHSRGIESWNAVRDSAVPALPLATIEGARARIATAVQDGLFVGRGDGLDESEAFIIADALIDLLREMAGDADALERRGNDG